MKTSARHFGLAVGP